MRLKGTKYPSIEALPAGAKPVSRYAKEKGYADAYVYVKYERYANPREGKKAAPYPGYEIRCYEGTNYVIET